jgi:hypothetical protein
MDLVMKVNLGYKVPAYNGKYFWTLWIPLQTGFNGPTTVETAYFSEVWY